jgi:stearoyl-CoA desaturase (delta-9 desaturase)
MFQTKVSLTPAGQESKRRRTESDAARAAELLEESKRMARLVIVEANASFTIAVRMVSKLCAVSLVGYMLAGNCVGNFCSTRFSVPIGILILAVTGGWVDLIGNECSCNRFFPNVGLNKLGAIVFRWQWYACFSSTVFAVTTWQLYSSVGTEYFGQPTFHDRVWLFCKLALIPLTLMLIGKANEPFRFRHARSDIEKATVLLQQLAAARADSQSEPSSPVVDSEKIPFYKLGSVASLLHEFVANYDASDKLKVVLAQTQESTKTGALQFLSVAYAPFRRVAGDMLLWESRDAVLYVIVALYMALVYAGSYHSGIVAPLCIVVPFCGPKSRVAQQVQALQKNVRETQGKVAEKKGGLEPAMVHDDFGFSALNWPMIIYLGSAHLAALWAILIALFCGGACPIFGNGRALKWQTIVFFGVMYMMNALGVTAGVHRLWAHRSYKANLPLRIVLMMFNSIANQGTIFHWARDHRLHHKYSDTKADPHDANRGFWFSHAGWLLVKKNREVKEAGRQVNVSDLLSDGVVMFQKRGDPFWNLMWCFAMPAFTVLLWEDTAWNGFLFAGALRYICALNATWAVNSVVHAWGGRPYNASHLTTENGWVSLFAIGEGWHNWHHAFPWDYAAAELEPMQQFNPTKVFIDAMAFLGCAWDRKRALQTWDQRKQRWEKEQGRPVVESLEGPFLFKQRLVAFGPTYEDHHEGNEDDDILNDDVLNDGQ